MMFKALVSYQYKTRGGTRRPSRHLSTSTGTRTRIFPFNEFAQTVGLKELAQFAEGTGQTKENLASNIPRIASAFSTILESNYVTI